MTKLDPNIELHIRDTHDKLREDSDKRYAVKLVERIVFGLVTLILTGVLGALLALIIRSGV